MSDDPSERIATHIMARLPLDGIEDYSDDALSQSDIMTALVDAVRRGYNQGCLDTDRDWLRAGDGRGFV